MLKISYKKPYINFFYTLIQSIQISRLAGYSRVAINQFYDLYRKQQKQVLVSFENFEFVDDTLLPEEHVVQSEMKKEIQVILDQLTPLHKQLLLLKYEINLSYEEIAEMLDLNLGTLKTYLFRARNAFKEKYRKEQTKHDRLQRK